MGVREGREAGRDEELARRSERKVSSFASAAGRKQAIETEPTSQHDAYDDTRRRRDPPS